MIVNFNSHNDYSVPNFVGFDVYESYMRLARNPNWKMSDDDLYISDKACMRMKYDAKSNTTTVTFMPGRTLTHPENMLEFVFEEMSPICPGLDNERFS